MIRYALRCVGDHEFEAWFSNSAAYDRQEKRGLIECPECGSHDVAKQIMAPAVRDFRRQVGLQPRKPSLRVSLARCASTSRRPTIMSATVLPTRRARCITERRSIARCGGR